MKKPHYLDNNIFTEQVRVWVENNKHLKRAEREPISNEIVTGFMIIARRYASKPNFSGYPFKEDLIQEAVYFCIRYAHNFDIEKSTNAFSYFTQYCHNAFIQYITKEKKYSKFKFDMVKNSIDESGTFDTKEISLYDEDNEGIAREEKVEQDMIDSIMIKDDLNENV